MHNYKYESTADKNYKKKRILIKTIIYTNLIYKLDKLYEIDYPYKIYKNI